MSLGLGLSLSFCWSYHVSSGQLSERSHVWHVSMTTLQCALKTLESKYCFWVTYGLTLDLPWTGQLKKKHNMILISTWWGNKSSRGNWRRQRRRERELGRTRRSSSPQIWSCWTRRTLCSSEFWGGKKILRRCCLSLLHHVECKY